MASTTPGYLPPGSSGESGALDSGQATGSVALEMDSSVSISPTTLQPKAIEVVSVDYGRAMTMVIDLLSRIDARLAHLEESNTGFSS